MSLAVEDWVEKFSKGRSEVILDAHFRERQKKANEHFKVPNYVAVLQKDLEESRQRIVKWTPEFSKRAQIDRDRIARLKQNLDYYGVIVPPDARDNFTPTPKGYVSPDKPGGFHVPGSHYIGPGTDDFTRSTTTTADAIAREHDIAYNKSRNADDIRNADWKAIEQFHKEFRHGTSGGSQAQALVGLGGMLAKYGVESMTGVLYGTDNEKKKTIPGTFSEINLENLKKAKLDYSASVIAPMQAILQHTPPTPPDTPNKRQRTQAGSSNQGGNQAANIPAAAAGTGAAIGSAVAIPMDTGGGEAAANPAAYGAAGDNLGPVPIGQGHTPSSTAIFTKKFVVETQGFSLYSVSSKELWPNLYSADATQNLAKALVVPVGCIDPNQLQWYLSRAEFDNLPHYTIAESCRISCRPLGYRIPFATNQSVTENANSSATLVQVNYGVGINHKFDGSIVNIKVGSDDPAKPTNVSRTAQELEKMLYNSASCAIIGEHPTIHNYYAINKHVNLSSDKGYPYLMKAVTVINIADVRGSEVVNFEHKFNCAPLKSCKSIIHGTKYFAPGRANDYPISGVRADATESAGHVFLDLEPYFKECAYEDQIEKHNFLSWRADGGYSSIMPPYVNIGNFALRSDSPLTGKQTYLPVTVQWEVSTELSVTMLHEFPYSHIAHPHPQRFNIFCASANHKFSNDTTCHYNMAGSVYLEKPFDNENVKTIGKSKEAPFKDITGVDTASGARRTARSLFDVLHNKD